MLYVPSSNNGPAGLDTDPRRLFDILVGDRTQALYTSYYSFLEKNVTAVTVASLDGRHDTLGDWYTAFGEGGGDTRCWRRDASVDRWRHFNRRGGNISSGGGTTQSEGYTMTYFQIGQYSLVDGILYS